jgi:hypothetical protein
MSTAEPDSFKLLPMKTTIHVCFALLCLSIAEPEVQAVIPAPDGGYPVGNTAEGQNALLSRTIGNYNTAIGFFSLKALTFAEFNTGVGAGTLFFNNAHQNTATGAGALLNNVTGHSNTANGAFALLITQVATATSPWATAPAYFEPPGILISTLATKVLPANRAPSASVTTCRREPLSQVFVELRRATRTLYRC